MLVTSVERRGTSPGNVLTLGVGEEDLVSVWENETACAETVQG